MEDTELRKYFSNIHQHFVQMDTKLTTMEQSISEQIDDLAAITGTNFVDVEERLSSKIAGVQRSVDGAYERQGALEAHISKIDKALQIT